LGAPVAANRGASGIDGVMSTAAGFASGLGRAVTLLVGDISFLHDVNGLNLLRTGAAPDLQLCLNPCAFHHFGVFLMSPHFSDCADALAATRSYLFLG
jgi:hypothetical protein